LRSIEDATPLIAREHPRIQRLHQAAYRRRVELRLGDDEIITLFAPWLKVEVVKVGGEPDGDARVGGSSGDRGGELEMAGTERSYPTIVRSLMPVAARASFSAARACQP
jgi:hypothetical protein